MGGLVSPFCLEINRRGYLVHLNPAALLAADLIHRGLRAREDGLLFSTPSSQQEKKPSPPRDCKAEAARIASA
jgi:hypothetical protein